MELSPSLISHQASVDVKPYLLLLPRCSAGDLRAASTAMLELVPQEVVIHHVKEPPSG